ncbi:MAG: hypothetical protein ACRDRI_00610 [Pseudonocardiaceae bacterium]
MDKSLDGEPVIGQSLTIADMNMLVLPLDPYRRLSGNLQASTKAEQLLLSHCLKRFGFDVPPQISPSAQPSGNAQLYGIVDTQSAESRGYHGPTHNVGEQPQADPYSPAAHAVIIGEGQRSYGGQQVPEGGCLGEAERTLAEGAPTVEDPILADRLANESWLRSQQDSRVLKVFAEWSTCMKRAGFDYVNPRKANNDPEFVSGEPTSKEIAVAVADVRCRNQVNLRNVWATVHAAYERRALERHAAALAVMKKNIETREKNAAAVLARAWQAPRGR